MRRISDTFVLWLEWVDCFVLCCPWPWFCEPISILSWDVGQRNAPTVEELRAKAAASSGESADWPLMHTSAPLTLSFDGLAATTVSVGNVVTSSGVILRPCPRCGEPLAAYQAHPCPCPPSLVIGQGKRGGVDLNHRPPDSQSGALPAAPPPRTGV